MIKLYTELTEQEKNRLNEFLERNISSINLYHYAEFSKFINITFNYNNLSLVAFTDDNSITGYVPQWQKGNVIESVPWRDKGGPIYNDDDVLAELIVATKSLVKTHKSQGFIWKDFKTDQLDHLKYFINVDIKLESLVEDSFKKHIKANARRNVNAAEKNSLTFVCEKDVCDEKLEVFHDLFTQNRKRLGVPAFSLSFFKNYFKCFCNNNIKLFNVYTQEKKVISSLILLHNQHMAVYAYPASSTDALPLKANDLLVFSVIDYCIKNHITKFDFGADSPVQEGLIRFKTKWCGEKREVVSSYYGNVKEMDHNLPKFNIIKKIISKLPSPLYTLCSKITIR